MRTGRPSFQIDQKRLRAIRDEKGLTQEELARRAYENLRSKKPPRDKATRTRHYQRIESSGQTSRAMAKALAEELVVRVASSHTA